MAKAKENPIDGKTMALIERVKTMKKEIAETDRPNWRTNCSFPFSLMGTVKTVNLHVETELPVLVGIVASLLCVKDYFSTANDALDTKAPLLCAGYAVEDWIHDVKARIAKVQVNEKRKLLEALEERLNKIVSPELRARMELEDIEKTLTPNA